MNCKYTNKDRDIAEYIAGELTEPDRTKFEEHLLECEICYHKVFFLEKATMLIRAEGKKAFEHKSAFSEWVETILEFFRSIGKIRLPKIKFVFPTVLAGLAACSFLIYMPISNKFIADLPSSIGSLTQVRDYGGPITESRMMDYKLSRGYSAYQDKDYAGALALFTNVATDLQRTDQTEHVLDVQFKTQLGLGMTKAALWKQQDYGYFQWIKEWTRLDSVDQRLLEEAEQHLLDAQVLADQSGIDTEDKVLLNELLTTIQTKTNSQ